ncbi:adenosine receptor A2b isoform X1 [Megalopta genalis]|uniref:adenosine receptor A2b isoform X1 n=1 Tax=Megalopta genalis TaxID=115081 RepID=UPI003FD599BA
MREKERERERADRAPPRAAMEFPSNTTELADNVTLTAVTASTSSELNPLYTVCEILVAVCAIFGNGLVIIVFSKERKLRRRTNYYIISLATADLLVGLFAIPFAILASIGLPTNLHACLFTVSVLMVLCTISIFCLVAVSVDRYWAILHPMGYSRTVRTKTAIGIICLCWVAGTLVGFLPLLGWNTGKKSNEKCIFTEVMDYDYLVFLYFATIIFPALIIAAFYAHIYRVVVKQLQQIVTMNPGRRIGNQTTTGPMLRLLGAARKREVKATQNLSRIVIFFIICWFPLYTINCVMAFCPRCKVNDILMHFCIILSHLNSAGNPLLYAYHLKDFRAALKNFMWKLLFPNSDVKSSVVSVIHDRGSLVGSQRQLQRQAGLSARNQRSSLLRQVTDVRCKPTAMSRNASIREKEVMSEANDGSSSSHSDKQEADGCSNDNVSQNSNEDRRSESDNYVNDRIDSSLSRAPSCVSSMELQTYKPMMPLLTAEINRVEETPPASIFVIEVDVNHVDSVREITDEGTIERKDEG